MDEMTELKGLWSDTPPGGDRELGPSRALLMSAVREPRSARAGGRWLHVPATVRRRGWWRAGLAVGLATAVAGGIVVTQAGLGGPVGRGGPDRLPAVQPVSAEQVLEQAARAAVDGRLRPAPDQYVHTELRVTELYHGRARDGGTLTMAYLIGREERWVPADGDRPWLLRRHVAEAAPVPGTAFEPPAWVGKAGPEDIVHSTSCPPGSSGPGAASWPAEVGPLRALVEKEAAKATAVPERLRVWGAVGTALRESALRPELTASLYRIAAQIEGITLVPDTVDVAGRSGVGVAMDRGDGRREMLVFEKGTYRYLGEQVETTREVTTTVKPPRGPDRGKTITWVTPKGTITGSAVVGATVADGLPSASENASKIKVPC
jgi:hypothetical protein